MTDTPETPDTPNLPATPPAKRNHKAWSRRKMVVFLRELAASQSVAQSARAVGMSRQSAYRLRNRLRGTPFDLGWETALELGFSQLAQAVMDRAVNGEEVPHYHGGELVGTHRKYDNRLAQWILKNPWELGRMQVAREFTSPGFEALLERIEAHARELGIHRLDLGVMATNGRAMALYERAGFVREGLRRDAVRLRSGYVDEWTMAKLIGADAAERPPVAFRAGADG